MLDNFALQWKKYVNFKELKYNDFIEDFFEKECKSCFYLNKIDGQLGALVYSKEHNSIFFVSVNDKIIKDIPVLDEYKQILDSRKDIKSCVIIGELCAARNKKILTFSETESIIKTYQKKNNGDLIHHFPYDIFIINGKRTSDFSIALNILLDLFPEKKEKYIHIPEFDRGGKDEFLNLWKENVNVKPGIEGVVIRLHSGKALKVKPSISLDMVIIGAGNINLPSWPKEEISYIITAMMDKNKIFRQSSKVGTGFDRKTRQDLFKYVNENKLYETTKGEIFIAPEKIIEVEFGQYIKKNMISYEYKNKIYIQKGMKSSVTLRFPRFKRFREDKKANQFDIRISQIPDLSDE